MAYRQIPFPREEYRLLSLNYLDSYSCIGGPEGCQFARRMQAVEPTKYVPVNGGDGNSSFSLLSFQKLMFSLYYCI